MFWDDGERIVGHPWEILKDLETWELEEYEEPLREELRDQLEAMDCMYVLCSYDPMGAWFVQELVAR